MGGRKLGFIGAIFFSFIFLAETVKAHCPLCTMGAAAAAGGALWLGVNEIIVALFLGGFAMSMGIWSSKIIKKKYFSYQNILIITIVFASTFLPILPLITSEHNVYPIYISIFGNYGSLFNRTYMIYKTLFSGLFGAFLILSSPPLSRQITKLRKGKIIPFQGVALTLLLLIITGGIIQILI